jgi:hypothetical protein
MRTYLLTFAFIYLAFLLVPTRVFCQKAPPTVVAGIPVNYDEALVGSYTLPDPLTLQNGTKVTDKDLWLNQRRPEIIRLYEEYQFGKAPHAPADLSFNVFDKGTLVFNGTAIRKQVTIYFTKDTSANKMDLLIYVPVHTTKPSPLLLNLSFSANSNAVDDEGIKPGKAWSPDGKRILAPKSNFGKLNVEQFITAGIGIATLCYTDIEPDFKKGINFGIRSLYLQKGATQPEPNEWGAIASWAWALSRAMDYLETDENIDSKRIAITGASRLGKTVLWAGATDTRFAMVIASISGEGGAALSRRNFGETIKHITDTSRYQYQFAANYHNFSDRVNELPVDGHMLISLIAPRPLLLQTGNTDLWSDPKGEFLAAVAAEPVYNLFGLKGPETTVMPKAGEKSLLNHLAYFMHEGGHTVLPEDWKLFIEFMKKHL